jgi:hypothetical protein
VAKNSADEEQRHLTQAGVAITSEERLSLFPERHVHVHAGAVVAEERLRHERDRLAVFLRDVADDVLVVLHPIAHLLHRREADIDLRLARRGDFVMLALDRDARFLELEAHLVRMSCCVSAGETGK